MHLRELTMLTQLGESTTMEFKKSTAEKDRACRTLCAFANGHGGQLLFGITPTGKLVGQTVTDRTLEELAQEFQGFEPSISPDIQRIRLETALEVISHEKTPGRSQVFWHPLGGPGEARAGGALKVGHATTAPVAFRGVPYERVLNTTRVMPRANYQRLLIESLHKTDRWEMQGAQGWTIDMLDTTEITLTIDEAIRRGRSGDPGTREPQAILRGLGLLTGEDQLSRAAVALFCKGDIPLPDFPQFKLRLARFKGTTRNEFLDNRQYHGNAFDLMRRAERFLIDWLPVAGRVVGGKLEREDTPALPVEAVREALANAFVHRDYASASGSIGVALYDDRLEIISPGELHFGLTPAMLQKPHESMPWNPFIANTFYRRGHIETWGRGTIKIAELLMQANREPLIVTSDMGAVTVTFRLPPRDGGVSGGVSGGVNGGVNTAPESLLLYIVEHPGLHAKTLAEALNTPRRTVERLVKQLRDASLIEYVGAPKTGGYHAKNQKK